MEPHRCAAAQRAPNTETDSSGSPTDDRGSEPDYLIALLASDWLAQLSVTAHPPWTRTTPATEARMHGCLLTTRLGKGDTCKQADLGQRRTTANELFEGQR